MPYRRKRNYRKKRSYRKKRNYRRKYKRKSRRTFRMLSSKFSKQYKSSRSVGKLSSNVINEANRLYAISRGLILSIQNRNRQQQLQRIRASVAQGRLTPQEQLTLTEVQVPSPSGISNVSLSTEIRNARQRRAEIRNRKTQSRYNRQQQERKQTLNKLKDAELAKALNDPSSMFNTLSLTSSSSNTIPKQQRCQYIKQSSSSQVFNRDNFICCRMAVSFINNLYVCPIHKRNVNTGQKANKAQDRFNEFIGDPNEFQKKYFEEPKIRKDLANQRKLAKIVELKTRLIEEQNKKKAKEIDDALNKDPDDVNINSILSLTVSMNMNNQSVKNQKERTRKSARINDIVLQQEQQRKLKLQQERKSIRSSIRVGKIFPLNFPDEELNNTRTWWNGQVKKINDDNTVIMDFNDGIDTTISITEIIDSVILYKEVGDKDKQVIRRLASIKQNDDMNDLASALDKF